MTTEPSSFLDGRVTLHGGDCLAVMKAMASCSVDSVVTDPPYHLTSIVKRFGGDTAAPAKVGKTGAYARASTGFMGKQWDGGDIAFQPELWAEVLRVLKPGGYVAAFSGTRTYHRMACAIEDAGFDVRDMCSWQYGSGFPKNLDISKAIDKAAGAEREVFGVRSIAIDKWTAEGRRRLDLGESGHYEIAESGAATDAARRWAGYGTALKPAFEPICLARKPIEGTNVENVLKHGVGALNIDGCRVEAPGETITNHGESGKSEPTSFSLGARIGIQTSGQQLGRWPANIVHDGSDEVLSCFPSTAPAKDGRRNAPKRAGILGAFSGEDEERSGHADSGGSAARFFYSAKADSDDRMGSKHPTVKPVDLMQWLVRLVTPKGGLVLDPFAGTGTTGAAAWREGMRAVLIEREPEYQADIARRMALCLAGPEERARASIKARHGDVHAGPLFGFEAAE